MADYIVTGTLSPDATGSYSAAGDFNGHPYYVRSDSAFYIAYVTDRYYILDGPPGGTINDSWIADAADDNPLGTYSPYLGASSGTATVGAAPASETGSGGIIITGAASASATFRQTGSGGFALGGSAPASVSLTPITAAGGFSLTGDAIAGFLFQETVSGSIAIGGAVGPAVVFTPAASGGIVLGGAVGVATTYKQAASGGIVLGGEVLPNAIEEFGSGSIALGGSASAATTFVPAASGGIVLAGAAAPAVRHTHYVDILATYRIFGTPEYRIYRSQVGPPEEGDTPAATASSLPATPALAWADGSWWVSVSYFNGIYDSGFLAFGPRGETAVRLDLDGGEEIGVPPAAPLETWLKLAEGGVVRVGGMYMESDAATRGTQWAIAYTTDGTDPAEGSPTVTQALGLQAGVLDILQYDLPAAAHGTTVKVRVQVRRQDGATWRYSEGSAVLSAVADATGPSAALAGVAWAGKS